MTHDRGGLRTSECFTGHSLGVTSLKAKLVTSLLTSVQGRLETGRLFEEETTPVGRANSLLFRLSEVEGLNDFGSVAGIDATDVLQVSKSEGTKRFHLFTARSVFEKLGRAFFATVRANQPTDVAGCTLAVPFVACVKNDVREGVPVMIRLLLKLLHGSSSGDITSAGTTFGHSGAKILGAALFVSIGFRRRDAWVSIFEVSLDATDAPRLGKRRKTHLADSAGPGTTFRRYIMGRLHNLRGQAHPGDPASFFFGVPSPKVVVFGLTDF